MTMLRKKQGFPEEGEIILCTVTRVHYNSVFVQIEEYGKQGMIHISEVSPGRIRNLNDYVKVGKSVYCKVLRINEERGHIDLSLRRVSESQKRAKADQLKQEQKAEKIIEIVANELKIPLEKLYDDLAPKLLEKYDSIYAPLEAVVEENLDLKNTFGFETKVAELLEKSVRTRIKPKEVEIKGEFTLRSYAPDGLEQVKSLLLSVEGLSKKIELHFLGGGKYALRIKTKEYKEAEDVLKNATDILEAAVSSDVEYEFKRSKKK